MPCLLRLHWRKLAFLDLLLWISCGIECASSLRPGEILEGHEAAGLFRHVAGSACCHPQASPHPVVGTKACASRCAARKPCDAFIFSPGTNLCFLVRYDERGPDGGPLQIQTRPAVDRIFGRAGVETSSEKGYFAGAEDGFLFENVFDCTDCSSPEGAEFFFDVGDDRPPEANFTQWQEWFQQRMGVNESCLLNLSCPNASHFGVFVDMDESHTDDGCCGPGEWEAQFRKTKAHVWHDKATCMAECDAECLVDLKDMQHQMLQQVKEMIRHMKRMFGESMDETLQDVFVMDFGSEEEDAGVCRRTCKEICDNFSNSSGRDNGTSPGVDRCAAGMSSANNTAREMSEILAHVMDALQRSLQQAGTKIKDTAPQLFDKLVPELPGGDIDPVSWLDVADGFDDPTPEAAMELLASMGAEPGPMQMTSYTSAGVAQVAGRRTSARPKLDIFTPKGMLGSKNSVELLPSRTSFFQGLPAATRWAEGSPPFLQRLLQRAAFRLNTFAQGFRTSN